MDASRWRVALVGVAVSGLVLAACGASATINQAISSIGASPYLQVHLSATFTGAATASDQQVLNELSFDIIESSTSGQSLTSSASNVSAEVDVNVGSQSLASVRDVANNLYVELNAQALSSLPGVNLSQQEIASLELVFANRWFEIPESLLRTYEATKSPTEAQKAKEQAIAQQIVKNVTAVIEKTKYTTLPNGGYSETGTLKSIVNAVLPTIVKLEGHAIPTGKVAGTYKIAVTMSGSTATGASIAITAPNGTSGNATVALNATITHNTQSVVAPTDATVITPALIAQLEGQVSSA
ncbi:MAG: hypothetical protein ABSC34_00340 [Acidimicrobiales bacterium]|jgi:hypothetical protein